MDHTHLRHPACADSCFLKMGRRRRRAAADRPHHNDVAGHLLQKESEDRIHRRRNHRRQYPRIPFGKLWGKDHRNGRIVPISDIPSGNSSDHRSSWLDHTAYNQGLITGKREGFREQILLLIHEMDPSCRDDGHADKDLLHSILLQRQLQHRTPPAHHRKDTYQLDGYHHIGGTERHFHQPCRQIQRQMPQVQEDSHLRRVHDSGLADRDVHHPR